MVPPLSPSVLRLDGPFSHRYAHTRGLRLHVAEARPATEPDGLVLLLHDAFGGWFDYREVLAPLADAGYHALAVDLRGYGLSDKPPIGPTFGIHTLVSDLAGLIPTLGYERASVVGSGAGAVVAAALAAAHPELVQHAIRLGDDTPAARGRELRRDQMLAGAIRLTGWAPRGAIARLAVSYLRRRCSPEFRASEGFRRARELRGQAAQVGTTAGYMVRTAWVATRAELAGGAPLAPLTSVTGLGALPHIQRPAECVDALVAALTNAS
ncbi:alpha/beta fold hydrolase [Corynebacterium uterequi]|uniref:Alpha/beta hydrolase family n=1 Tax=Corynebacterium uterequi TaxID=1072256 RepID=A0A0G3HA56_9CORY|nr:alpha/beta hydrolase [Corynebacterium uterequi]AKK10194.1 Alpha/beta hydrolase family [Corynebacterium uterequi]